MTSILATNANYKKAQEWLSGLFLTVEGLNEASWLKVLGYYEAVKQRFGYDVWADSEPSLGLYHFVIDDFAQTIQMMKGQLLFKGKVLDDEFFEEFEASLLPSMDDEEYPALPPEAYLLEERTVASQPMRSYPPLPASPICEKD